MKHLYISILIFLFLLVVTVQVFSQAKRPHHPPLDRYQFHLLPSITDAGVYNITRTDFWITMRDGVKIDALKYVPVGTPPSGGWPTVMMVHGYGDNKETLAEFCRAQAEYGYYTMTFTVRGQGHSEGLSNLISKTEMQDLIEIINWLKADNINGSNPNKILIMGGSQGGLLPYMAACNGANVRTIISALAPPNFASNWIENGSIKMTFLWTIGYTPDTARYTPLVARMTDWVYANNKEKWDSLAYWLPKDRDFMDQVANCNVPMLIEGSWQDKFFNAAGISQGLSLIKTPFISYLGAVRGHGGDPSTTEDQWHMQFFNDWFFYWLYDVQNGILNKPKFQFASTTSPFVNNAWTFKHDSSTVWPAQNVKNLKLYFSGSAYLDTIPFGNPSSKVTLKNQVASGLTMQQAVLWEFTGTTFKKKFIKKFIVFDTDPLTADLQMSGTVKLKLDYMSDNAPFCQFNFQLIELTPDGTEYFVTRANYTDRNYVKGQRRSAYFNGQAHSHIFKAGSQIRLKVTNLDTAPSDSTFSGTNPFVLPVLLNATHTIFFSSNSYLEIPVKGGILKTGSLSGNRPLSENVVNEPVSYSLNQNYPNPFNPSTSIKYSISNPDVVELKVFDILGREVKTLVNKYQQAGKYEVVFNSDNLSSGLYFYKIKSGNYQSVKRMILIK